MKLDHSIVLLHATPVAIAPIQAAFATDWPEAKLSNLLDDGLTAARGKSRDLDDALRQRFVRLARYGSETGANAVLATCSAFGPAIEAADEALPIPVCKPNTAMFADALAQGQSIAMLATFAPALPTMVTEFFEEAERSNPGATLSTFLVDDAIDHLRAGDAATHNRLVADKAASLHGYDAIMLAHFSTAQALDAVTAVAACPVFSAPRSAIAHLKRRLGVSC
ncbi:arylsulfatase [Caballeronia sp. LZ034LL]|uniref:arylsulfatase n=1 Tax=Caballeronia sp. LZ034LL TaxID=3038567 RepID=UPI00285D615E|nr:arylsulfatase [Caballeronia sp. LZ034LL]MDR5836269.1 arylsulfatase [Caballeronia sp. LZ034LL]